MARNVMLSDDVYKRLKEKKKKEGKSFSEVIKESLDKNENKTFKDLMKHYGALEGDTEYEEVLEKARENWKEWTKKYA